MRYEKDTREVREAAIRALTELQTTVNRALADLKDNSDPWTAVDGDTHLVSLANKAQMKITELTYTREFHRKYWDLLNQETEG
jgi:hypothetical protein